MADCLARDLRGSPSSCCMGLPAGCVTLPFSRQPATSNEARWRYRSFPRGAPTLRTARYRGCGCFLCVSQTVLLNVGPQQQQS